MSTQFLDSSIELFLFLKPDCIAGLIIEYMIKLKTRGARTLFFYHC